MDYLKPFEIQNPNKDLEKLIYLLQDLTTEQNLKLTKAGLDKLIQHIENDFTSNDGIYHKLKDNYDNGYQRGYDDGKDEGYSEGYDDGKVDGYNDALHE